MKNRSLVRLLLPTLLLLIWGLGMSPPEAYGQGRTVEGTVTSAVDNSPLEGVSVRLKGTTRGALTGQDGKFSLAINGDDDVLILAYIGFSTQEVTVGGGSSMTISMKEDVASLDEVVVIGYGTQAKRDVTAAIASVKGEDIRNIPVASTVQALQGQVAGVDIQQSSGRPGAAPTILIRGRRSINASNEPLYVVDGIPLTDGGTAFDINPQDIKSVEILKDAAATAIYGSRGANGVILITTRRGESGKTSINYDGYIGVSSAIRQVDMMNGEEFAALKRESRRVDGSNRSTWSGTIPSDADVFLDPIELESIAMGNRSTDWQDLVLNQGTQQNHQISMRGGNAKTQFMVSGNVFDDQGIIEGMSYTRYSLRINLDHKVNDWLKIGTSTYLNRTEQNWGSSPAFGEALANNPLGVPYDADGELRFLPTNDGIRTNPLSELAEGAYEDERIFHTLFSSVFLEANIAKGLNYRATFGPDIRFRRRGWFAGRLTNTNRGGPAQARKEEETSFGYTLENLLTYNTDIGDSKLGLTFLQSIQGRQAEESWLQGKTLPYESQGFDQIGTAQELTSFGSDIENWQLASFMGRLNYDIAGKYLIQLSGRADGSSRLSDANKWAFFPGVSVGWRIIDEGFMSGVSWMQDLKLRASYGVVGNTSIDPYQTQGALRRTTYVFGTTPGFGYGLDQIPNSDLTWEKTATIDVGIDFALIRGRVEGNIDFYQANTTDLILLRQLPPSSGYTQVLENVGSTRNTGVEISLRTVNVETDGGFRWSTNFNWFRNKEEIVELFNGAEDDIGNGWFIGEPIRVFYDYEKIGIWQTSEEETALGYGDVPGEIKLNDVNGDGKYDPTDDRVILGSDVPSWSAGMTNVFEYKGFDLSVFFFSRWGHTIRSRFHDSNNSLFGRYNNLDVDYWTPSNPTNAFPRPNQDQERAKYSSTMTYFEGDYVKLRNATVGYRFTPEIAAKMKMSSLRIYASAQNPWFWAKYATYDPEAGGDNGQVSSGDIPAAKLFMVGVSVGF
ncbi:MAG: SusC/RagA family TonB-linked outer membrane protein [Bacteroidia bacterium]